MQDLTIALVQADLVWEDQNANLAAFDQRLDPIADKVQLIVLPEMFTTGFSMQPERLAQPMDGPAVNWMRSRSRTKNADLVGSLIIEEEGRYTNRLVWTTPKGGLYWYDKKHLFRFAGEHKVYTPGDSQLGITCHGWTIRPFICYDLRFPIWCRNIDNAYDAAIFVANWPEKRSAHWKALLTARAIENQCYVVGVNRVGVDGNGHRYSGDSAIIDPQGRLADGMSHDESVITATLSAGMLEAYRRDFPAWMDADGQMVVGTRP